MNKLQTLEAMATGVEKLLLVKPSKAAAVAYLKICDAIKIIKIREELNNEKK